MSRLRVSRLGRGPKARKHMFRTMVTQLFKHERIKTTLPKAMALRFPAERMITIAKTNTLQNAFQLSRKYLREKDVVFKLLAVLKLRYLVRNGGYTRVHKCGFRKSDSAPMAYIELVDSPKEIGKRIEKRPKVYPTIEELREKAPVMDIYNKPVLHVSENKRTSLLGGIVALVDRLRQIPIPTASEVTSGKLARPDLSVEFSNVPGPGQAGEKEAQAKIAQNAENIKKIAKEVLARRVEERKAERARARELLGMTGSKKKKKAAAAKAAREKAEKEGKGGEGAEKKAEGSAPAASDKPKQPQQQQNQNNKKHNNKS